MEEAHRRTALAYPGPPHSSFAGIVAISQSTSPSSSVSTPSTHLSSSLCSSSADALAHTNNIHPQNGGSPETSQSPRSDDSLAKNKAEGGAHVSQPGQMDTATLYFKQAQPASVLVENTETDVHDVKSSSDSPQENINSNNKLVHDENSSSPSRSYHHPRRRKKRREQHIDIANYPTPQLLHLLAELLTQIATSNDRLRKKTSYSSYMASPTGPSKHSSLPSLSSSSSSSQTRPPLQSSLSQQSSSSSSSQHFPPQQPLHPAQTGPSSALGDAGGTHMSPSPPKSESIFSAAKNVLHNHNSVLCFHARNVPNIAIEPYLFRILKYCPTTNEVFISLLVYFDRMARLISTPTHTFAIDSYNLHRLVIAGLTAASKFFSDVYYTNSRYAKVGGLPLAELNQLELQFLLLNDFRLRVSVEELQRYADQLLLRWNPHAAYPSPTSTSLSQPIDKVVSQQQQKPQLQPGTLIPVDNGNSSYSNKHGDEDEEGKMDYTEKKREESSRLPLRNEQEQHNNDEIMDTSPPLRSRSNRQSVTDDSDSSANSSATSIGSDATLMGY